MRGPAEESQGHPGDKPHELKREGRTEERFEAKLFVLFALMRRRGFHKKEERTKKTW